MNETIRPPRPIEGMEKPAPDWQDRLSRLSKRAREAKTAPGEDVLAARFDRSDGKARTDSY